MTPAEEIRMAKIHKEHMKLDSIPLVTREILKYNEIPFDSHQIRKFRNLAIARISENTEQQNSYCNLVQPPWETSGLNIVKLKIKISYYSAISKPF